MPVPVAEEDRVEVAVEFAVAVYSATEKCVLVEREWWLAAWLRIGQSFGKKPERASAAHEGHIPTTVPADEQVAMKAF